MTHRIVVVEDDTGIVVLLEDILMEEGYDVVSFTSPLEAIERVPHIHPDLIILDYLFAGETSGLRMLQALKRNPETVSIPVVICTALLWVAQEMDQYLATREVMLLWKPFSIDALLAVVQQMLGDDQPKHLHNPTK